MPERFVALLGAILLLMVLWGLWQLHKARIHARLKDRNAVASVLQGENGPVLLVFTTPHCTVCKRKQLPAVEEIAQEMGESLTVEEVDATTQPELAAQCGVITVPSSCVIDAHGSVHAMNHGCASADKLRHQLQQVLAPQQLSDSGSQALPARPEHDGVL
jgi:thioredoxin-like negative regulator of GroEL